MTPSQISKLKQGCYPIPQCPGLRLEIRQSKRTWTLRRRDDTGKLKQVALGHYPDLSLAGAMEAAANARRALGKPVVAQKAVTVRALLHAYCIGHIRANRKDWLACEARVWRHVGPIADRDAGDIGRADAHALVAGLAGRPAAQRWMRLELRAAWEYGMDTGLLPETAANPWARIRVPPAGVGTRVLSDAELVTLFNYLKTSRLGITRDAMLLTLAPLLCFDGVAFQREKPITHHLARATLPRYGHRVREVQLVEAIGQHAVRTGDALILAGDVQHCSMRCDQLADGGPMVGKGRRKPLVGVGDDVDTLLLLERFDLTGVVGDLLIQGCALLGEHAGGSDQPVPLGDSFGQFRLAGLIDSGTGERVANATVEGSEFGRVVLPQVGEGMGGVAQALVSLSRGGADFEGHAASP